jgi:hypothetical protein
MIGAQLMYSSELKIESSDSVVRQFDVLDLFLAILANDGQGNWNHLSLTRGKSN